MTSARLWCALFFLPQQIVQKCSATTILLSQTSKYWFFFTNFTLQCHILSTSGVALRWCTKKVWYPYILGPCGVCCRNVLSIPEGSTCASACYNHQPHFFFVKFHTNAKNASEIFCCMILDLWVKKITKFWKFNKFFHHLSTQIFKVGHFWYPLFTFWTSSRNLSPFNGKSLLRCLHVIQH
jgi:hypothetical protein